MASCFPLCFYINVNFFILLIPSFTYQKNINVKIFFKFFFFFFMLGAISP